MAVSLYRGHDQGESRLVELRHCLRGLEIIAEDPVCSQGSQNQYTYCL